MRLIAAQFVSVIHMILILFVVFGWLTPQRQLLYFHIALVIFMFLQWQLNQGMCLLTNVEHYLRTYRWYPEKKDPERSFVAKIIKKLTGKTPTETVLRLVVYFIPLISLGLSMLHLSLL